VKGNPAVKMAIWMILLLAIIWGLGYLMGYNGAIEPFKLG
jgi:hypothetical protein